MKFYYHNKKKYTCAEDCEECEGMAFVVTDLRSYFNSRRMDFDIVDVKSLCSNATEVPCEECEDNRWDRDY